MGFDPKHLSEVGWNGLPRLSIAQWFGLVANVDQRFFGKS